jgi:hypothetical protein
LPLDIVGYEIALNKWGERVIWVETHVARQPSALRRPHETWFRRHPAAGRDGGEGAALTGLVAHKLI